MNNDLIKEIKKDIQEEIERTEKNRDFQVAINGFTIAIVIDNYLNGLKTAIKIINDKTKKELLQ